MYVDIDIIIQNYCLNYCLIFSFLFFHFAVFSDQLNT